MTRAIRNRLVHSVAAVVMIVTPSLAQDWQPVPLISQAIRDAGVELGGEGAQIVRAIAIDSIDGNFVLFGTDVGGLYRSLDGGKTWEPCNVGYWPRGTAGMAIDPHNPTRVLSIGANSVPFDFHGIWLSTDQAASWKSVLPFRMSGSADRREQIAFDPNTFDRQKNLTTDVYWSRLGEDKPMWGKVESTPALYKSTDGGETWTELPDTAHLATGIVRVHPKARGVVYVANKGGVWRSDDAAGSFTRVWEGQATGLDVSVAQPDSLWLTDASGVYKSADRGASWSHIGGTDLARDGYALRHIKVSPVDPKLAVLWRDDVDGYDESWYHSTDGGVTWKESTTDSTLAFLPRNERWSHGAWHPKNAKTLINNGGDWPTRSDDGGKTYRWSASGQNAVLVGGSFNFSPHVPNTIFMASQDYNGSVSHDAGHTWTYLNVSGKGWGGYTYGGLAINKNTFVVGEGQSWSSPRQLKVTHDGGKTWSFVDGAIYSTNPKDDSTPRGIYVSFADPTDANIAFAGPYRTTDAGKTWTRMPDVFGVVAGSENPRVLFGIGQESATTDRAVLESRDGGATWKAIAKGEAHDVAFDRVRSRLYIARREKGLDAVDLDTGTVTTLAVPKDQRNGWRVRSVAVDPKDPSIVYVAQNKDTYASSVAVTRSTDAGQTWEVLTRQTPLDGTSRDGGREAFWVRVHPTTREAWFITGCYGIWKLPAAGEK
jgi:photosystem II stability/assembly factor-like uncharacterized protein